MPQCKRVSPACLPQWFWGAPKRTLPLKLSPEGDNFSHPIGFAQELPGSMKLNLFNKILVIIGSSASIGFGIWHFFVPKAWNWYSYIDVNATELVAAVRAINAFFSLSLVLFGMVNILFNHGDKSNRYSIIVMLAATCILWLMRVAFQVNYPQGTLYPGLQYGMLSAFVIVTLCYLIPLIRLLFQKIPV
jgi:hypothetical protein